MKITKEMISNARNVEPSLPDEVIEKLLKAGLEGQIIFAMDEGLEIIKGKPKYPDYGVIIIKNPSYALDLAQQMISGAQRAMADGNKECNVQLLCAGTASVGQ